MFPAAEAKAAQQHDAAVEKRRSGSGHSPPGAAEPRGQNPRTPAGGAAGAANNRPRKFLKPGRVQQFWSRIVGDSKGHKTSLLGFSSGRAGGSRGHENPAPAAGDGKDYPRNLADLSAYLRQPNKRPREAHGGHGGAAAVDEPLGLLTLPPELLMKIICSLSHDELTPLMATCRRLRQAAHAAKAVHFNFCTPSPQRDARDGMVLAHLRSPIAPDLYQAAMDLSAPAAPPRQRRHMKFRRRQQRLSGHFGGSPTLSTSTAGSIVHPARAGTLSLASTRLKFVALNRQPE